MSFSIKLKASWFAFLGCLGACLILSACGGEPGVAEDQAAKGDGLSIGQISLSQKAPRYDAPCVSGYGNDFTCDEGFFPIQCSEFFSCDLKVFAYVNNVEDFRQGLIERCEVQGQDECIFTVAYLDLERFGYPIWIRVKKVGDSWELDDENEKTVNGMSPSQGIKWSAYLGTAAPYKLPYSDWVNEKGVELELYFSWQ